MNTFSSIARSNILGEQGIKVFQIIKTQISSFQIPLIEISTIRTTTFQIQKT